VYWTSEVRSERQARDEVIELSKVSTRFGDHVVHSQIDLQVRRAEVLALIGGSGSGKSTLLREMILLQRPNSGSIRVLGVDLQNIGDDDALALRQRWGVMFQHGGLFGSLTVKENVGLPLREHSRLDDRLIDEIAAWKLAITGLKPEVGAQYPSELSGGMMKRASLARALALDPRTAVSRRADRRPRPRQRRRRRPARAQTARPLWSDHRHHHARPRPAVAGDRPRRSPWRRPGARHRLDVRALANGPPAIRMFFDGPRGRAAQQQEKPG
jgi:phospholipid/cholesterol/gamma-HCH transport system ATP-binding protein